MEHNIDDLRKKIEELEKQNESLNSTLKKIDASDEKPVVQREPRTPLRTPIELIGDFDILEADGVNISNGGICFELSSPLVFEMQYRINDEHFRHRAELRWVSRLNNGHSRLGLKFIPRA